MMQDSDNFIAEQLLLMCASLLSDSLSTDIAIEHVKKNLLADLVDEPNWVDGSGLSRYNLFTPRSIVQLWEKILYMVPRERLFALLAVGGKSGTIRNWYAKEEPFIYGKTGSLSNQHCVSGYLLTRKGKTLIFSFMNGNFTAPGNEIRRNMQAILNVIYDNY
jgi:D-alanyl-D-alanine carboxypeptidase/D-alanyl-D-alanine-endopeptidase (penicillin-binding protein 4)